MMNIIPQEFKMAYNPIFSAILIREIVLWYTKKSGATGIPSSLCLIGYTLSVDSRIQSYCTKPASFNLLKVIELSPEITVNLAERSRSLSTFALEALVISCEIGTLSPLKNGEIQIGPIEFAKNLKKAPFANELRQAQSIGVGFGKIPNSATIHTLLGVKP